MTNANHRTTDLLLGYALNVLYALILVIVFPVLLYRSIRYGKYRDGWGQKLWGQLPQLGPKNGERYWFHAVSVGEVLLLETVIPELLRRDPQAEIVISTTTSTGHAVAIEKFSGMTARFSQRSSPAQSIPIQESKAPASGRVIVCYLPLDFTWAVHRAMKRINPSQLILVELEFWPNLILATQRLGIPLRLINGRLGEKSYRGYSRIRWLMRRLLQCFDSLAVQTEEYAQRLTALGATDDRVSITGSIKFDRVQAERDNAVTRELRDAFDLTPDELVFVAGSTQAPEEKFAIDAWLAARRIEPSLRLILVPRHKERFEEVAALVESMGLPLQRRTDLGKSSLSPDNHPVLLLDTLGELTGCWGLADFAFVGGSLTNRGGQNMIEPAGYGAAVCFGPNTRNFRAIVEQLLIRDAAIVVRNEADLINQLAQWLKEPHSARILGARARKYVESQVGATFRTLDTIAPNRDPADDIALTG